MLNSSIIINNALKDLVGNNVRYTLTGDEVELSFSAPKATTRQELGEILEEAAQLLKADAIPHDPEMF